MRILPLSPNRYAAFYLLLGDEYVNQQRAWCPSHGQKSPGTHTAAHAATLRSSGTPICPGLPARPEREARATCIQAATTRVQAVATCTQVLDLSAHRELGSLCRLLLHGLLSHRLAVEPVALHAPGQGPRLARPHAGAVRLARPPSRHLLPGAKGTGPDAGVGSCKFACRRQPVVVSAVGTRVRGERRARLATSV